MPVSGDTAVGLRDLQRTAIVFNFAAASSSGERIAMRQSPRIWSRC
jgi:hypothetical protein